MSTVELNWIHWSVNKALNNINFSKLEVSCVEMTKYLKISKEGNVFLGYTLINNHHNKVHPVVFFPKTTI